MFKQLIEKTYKDKIQQFANEAVRLAEETLSSNQGKEKKAMAVDYVLGLIKIPAYLVFLKPFMKNAILNLADMAIEFAVMKLKGKLSNG